MNRTILFFAALILLASAGNTRAAFQDKKAGKPDPSVATAKNNASADDEAKLQSSLPRRIRPT